MKIGIAQLNLGIATLSHNIEMIRSTYLEALQNSCDLVIYPELATCGYNIKDLSLSRSFVDQVVALEAELCQMTVGYSCAMLVGTLELAKKEDSSSIAALDTSNTPLLSNPPIAYNTALFIHDGIIQNRYHKHHSPNYDLFEETRQFCSEPLSHSKKNNKDKFFTIKGCEIIPLICHDMWHQNSALQFLSIMSDEQNANNESLQHNRSSKKPIIVAINASPFAPAKIEARYDVARKIAKHYNAPLLYVNQVGGQDEMVFDGNSFVMNSNGKLCMDHILLQQGCILLTWNKFLVLH